MTVEQNGILLSTPLPSEELIYLVNGHRDRAAFNVSRRATAQNIIDLLAEAGIDYHVFDSIFDFGCGCGRVLAGWEGLLSKDTYLAGADINSVLVKFCQDNIPYAEVKQSSYSPPLDFPDSRFSFIYAASVFTHLTLPAMLCWAGELARIAKPDAILMVSFHWTYFLREVAEMGQEASRQLHERGYYVKLHQSPDKTFLGSNFYASFQTLDFMKSLFKGFDFITVYPGISRGPNPFASYQDIMLLRRLAD